MERRRNNIKHVGFVKRDISNFNSLTGLKLIPLSTKWRITSIMTQLGNTRHKVGHHVKMDQMYVTNLAAGLQQLHNTFCVTYVDWL